MPLGVGWQDCQPYPLAHSTHVFHYSPSRTHPWLVDTLTTNLGLLASHAQALGDFSLTQTFSGLHELLSTHELQIRVLPVSGASTGKNGFVFSSRRASIVCSFPCWVGLVTHALVFFCLGRT